MNLLLYIKICEDKFTYAPALPGKYRDMGVVLFDLDNYSGQEVMNVACEAVRRSDGGAVCIDIDSPTVSINKLYPLLKTILSYGEGFPWYLKGTHSGLGVLLKKAPSVISFENENDLENKLSDFFQGNCDSE